MKNLKIAAVTLFAGLALGTAARAEDLTKAQIKAADATIEADYKAAKMGCESLSGNAKEICVAEAKGKASVAKAEVLAVHRPSANHSYDLNVAKADAAYAIAIERCDDKGGNEKDVCVKEAKAAKVHAVADAKTQKTTWKANAAANAAAGAAGAKATSEVTEAKRDAASDKRDADYAVAKEKCDALAGEAKDACVNAAKARFGQH
jgi:hypothetical protein